MIFGAFERMLAGRYLRARRQEGFVSVIAGFSLLGIGLGVATLIIVMSVMTGFRTTFVSRVLGLSPHVTVLGTNGPTTGYEALAARIAAIPHVTAVVPTVEGQALLTQNGYASGFVVRGIREEDFARRRQLSAHLTAGSVQDFADDGVAIGARMAERLRLAEGDVITLISPKFAATPFGGIPRKASYRVAAIFDVGMFDVDSSLILMPLQTAQAFFQTGDGVTELDVTLDDPESGLSAAHRAIADAVGPDFRVIDWQQANFTFLNALDTERSTMFLILTLIILVAAFNIISSLIMLVKDKGADIAILRTMGATRGMVMRIFFMTGATIGVAGATLGVVLGVEFVRNIEGLRHVVQRITGTDVFAAALYIFPEIPAVLSWSQVATIVVMALALSFAFSIYPAWRASRIDPVEALRYE